MGYTHGAVWIMHCIVNHSPGSTSIVLKCLPSAVEIIIKLVIKSWGSLTPAKRYNCLFGAVLSDALSVFIVERKAFYCKVIYIWERLMNRHRRLLPTNTSRQCFHTCQKTKTMPCVICIFLGDDKAVMCIVIVASHPNILTFCQTDVKVKKLSCSVFSWDSKAVLILSAAVRCVAKCHSHPQWLASPACIQMDWEKRCWSPLKNKVSVV